MGLGQELREKSKCKTRTSQLKKPPQAPRSQPLGLRVRALAPEGLGPQDLGTGAPLHQDDRCGVGDAMWPLLVALGFAETAFNLNICVNNLAQSYVVVQLHVQER